MKMTAIHIEEKVDALLTCLDKDVQHLQEGLVQLDELRRWVIKRDDAALGRLLEKLQMKVNDYRRHERDRQSIRQDLATALGCDLGQVTLSALETSLPKARKDQVAEKKNKIKSLIEAFRREHLKTALLLSECVRFNNRLLRSLFDMGKVEDFGYDSNGAARRHANTALVNLQL
ncbi:MAG: hypothetical protein A2Z25_20550 [Planctomycetes bacterium RBG_16_55_9]|nr:MAG: hypothetical protein A2Z25_20550 [Planctomycetes bacterium RBG_16_55_9]